MPPGLFGEAYLNFGVAGFMLLHMFVGLVLRWVEKPYFRDARLTVMDVVKIATAGAMALHFIRGEFFAPFLVLIGIWVGARVVVLKKR